MMALKIELPVAGLAANDDPGAVLTRSRVIGLLDAETRIGGDGSAMLPAAVDAWAKAAAIGDELVYAIGHLPVWAKGPVRMRDLCGDGLVTLFQDSTQSPRHYVARRTSKPWTDAPAVVVRESGRRVSRPVASYDQATREALLQALVACAEAGRACPANSELGELIGLHRLQVAYLLRELVREGLIRRRPIEGVPFRVITIVATGARTGEPE